MEHGNFVQETAEIIRLAETAESQAFHPDKLGVVGKERLQGSEMTIDTLLMLVPACKWPAVGGKGCFRIDCTRGQITDRDHEQQIYQVIFEQKMRDGECAMTVGLAGLLNVHSYTLENSGYLDVYAPASRAWYKTWKDLVNSFPQSAYKTWRDTFGDFWGGILKRYRDTQRWPKIRHLFQTGVEDRFKLVDYGDTMMWQRKQILYMDDAGNVDFTQNRRCRRGQRIHDAYSPDNVLTTLEHYAADFQIVRDCLPLWQQH
jgi:hypothetical protein